MRTRTALTIAALAIVLIMGAEPAAAQVAPENTVSPTISGTARVGQALSASQGEWEGSPTSFFYQWLRCDRSGDSCSAIAGAVEPTYALTAAEVGHRIRVEVVAHNADGDSPAARSAATNMVRIPAPTSTAKPQVSGVPREGQTLSTTTGTWTGAPTAFAYQWKRCAVGQCVAIAGATASTYVLSAAEIRTRVRVQVTASNDGGKRSAQSKSTSAVRSSTAGFKLGPPKHDRKRGLARLRVTVPSSGILTLERTAKVRPDQRHAFGAGTLKLTVKPRRRARHRLHRRGKVRVRVKVSFTPDAGTPIFRDRRITLKSH